MAVFNGEKALHGPKVTAFTHYNQLFDLLALGHAETNTTGRPLRVAYDSDKFKDKVIKMGPWSFDLGEIFNGLDAFPVKVGELDSRAMVHGAELLKRGHNVGLAPQGRTVLSYDEKPKVMGGVGVISMLGGAPIQPTAIIGNVKRIPYYGERLFEDNDYLPTIYVPHIGITNKYAVRYGEPVDMPEEAKDFKLENLDRVRNEETDREEIVIPRELFSIASKYRRQWEPKFYENFVRAVDDFANTYGHKP